jgi:hypothetical protein
MPRRVGPDDARRRRRALDTARWRSRRRRGVELFSIEAGPAEYDLTVKFGGLREGTTDKRQIAVALGKLLRRALVVLLREESRKL